MLVQTYEELDGLLKELETASIVVLDTETTGLYPYMADRIIGISLFLPEYDYSYYVPFRHGEGFNWPIGELRSLYGFLSDPTKSFYGWNVKFDLHFLQVDGFPILQRGCIYNDCMIALHMLDENRYDIADLRGLNYKLKDNARLFLGTESAEAEDVLKEEMKARGIKGKGDMWKMPASLVSQYAEDDVKLTWQLFKVFEPYLIKWDQLDLFYEKAKFNSTILARMENHGTPVSKEKIDDHIASNSVRIKELLAELKTTFGEGFNPNSPQQVAKALNVDNAKKATLSQLGTDYAESIMEYKYRTKAEGTFYKPYLWYSAFDGKIHPTFNVTRTVTGRLSSSDPNLQQVPRFSDKYRVKEVFQAPDGYLILQADYSQEELRLACNFSGQENMTKAFLEDRDTHILTASYFFNVDEQWLIDEIKNKNPVAKTYRQIAKTENFGLLYGMGYVKNARYMSENLKRPVSEKESKKFVSSWRELYPKFVSSLNSCAVLADTIRTTDGRIPNNSIHHLENGVTQTTVETGYKYYRLEDGTVRHYIKGQRPFTAWNFLIQGTGGIIMRKALMRTNEMFSTEQDDVYPIISVHDSVVLLVRESKIEDTKAKVKAVMEDFPQYYPPMKVDIQIGKDWGNL